MQESEDISERDRTFHAIVREVLEDDHVPATADRVLHEVLARVFGRLPGYTPDLGYLHLVAEVAAHEPHRVPRLHGPAA